MQCEVKLRHSAAQSVDDAEGPYHCMMCISTSCVLTTARAVARHTDYTPHCGTSEECIGGHVCGTSSKLELAKVLMG